MAKNIKINSNQNLGKILADIEASSEQDIVLEIASEDMDEELISNIKRFASKVQKTVNVKNTDNFNKVGFVTGGDITNTDIQAKPIAVKTAPKIKFKKPKIKMDMFSKFNGIFSGGKTGLLVFPAIFLIVVGLFFYLLFYVFHNAEIDLTVEPKVFTASEDVTISDSSSSAVKATSVTKTITDTIEGAPTGEKETGEKANGTIKIYNKTDKDKEVKAGTTVTIKTKEASLTFTTDEKVVISAKTTQDITDNGTTKKADVFGESEVDITATTFGTNYNLNSKDIKSDDIKVAGLDSTDISAELSSSTKGGSSKKVTAVLQKDIDQLTDDLKKRITKKVTDVLKNEVSNNNELLEGAVNVNFNAPTVNAKVNDEIDNIKITLSATADALTYNKEELKTYLVEKVSKNLPNEYESSKENFDIFASVKDKTTDPKTFKVTNMQLSVKVQNKIVQKLDTEKIKSDLVGLSNQEAYDYLSKIDNIKDLKIKQSPNLPQLLKNMPKSKNNIKINVNVEE